MSANAAAKKQKPLKRHPSKLKRMSAYMILTLILISIVAVLFAFLNRVITRGLVMSGRKANMTIALEDKPGQLKKVAEIVSRCGSNVVSVQHDGSDPNMPISSCFLKLTLETRDAEQIEQIRAELAKEGFQLVSERV